MLTDDEQGRRHALRKAKPRVHEKVLQYETRVNRGESIAIIQFQYDYRCNLRCQHCCISMMAHDRPRLTLAHVSDLCHQADTMGLAHFVITGGEPLIFPDFDDLVETIGPNRFYISCDTNGWYLDQQRARHLKSIGIDKIQLSLDSIDPEEHDAFRGRAGSHARALRAIDATLDAGLNLILATVVTRKSLRSENFITLLEFANARGVGVFVTFAKPVGAWQGCHDLLVDHADLAYERELEEKYNVFTHLTPAYGLELGCIAVKRMISITPYGDVMPCPYIHVSLGNILEEPLADIVSRGLAIRHFREYADTCWIALERDFIERHDAATLGRKLPVPYTDLFAPDERG